MSRHRYPPKALAGDYLRAAAGFLVTGGPALLAEPWPAVKIVLGALALLFAVFGVRVCLRHATVIAADERTIEARGLGGTRLAWNEIHQVRLDYFSTRRDGRSGWMQMKISGRSGRIRAESTIEDFEGLAATVVAMVPANTGMTDTTQGNFRALGIAVGEREERAPA